MTKQRLNKERKKFLKQLTKRSKSVKALGKAIIIFNEKLEKLAYQ